MNCDIHNQQLFDYCEQCQALICEFCHQYHAGHLIKSLVDHLKELEIRIEQDVIEIQNKQNEALIKELFDYLDRFKFMLLDIINNHKNRIERYFQLMKDSSFYKLERIEQLRALLKQQQTKEDLIEILQLEKRIFTDGQQSIQHLPHRMDKIVVYTQSIFNDGIDLWSGEGENVDEKVNDSHMYPQDFVSLMMVNSRNGDDKPQQSNNISNICQVDSQKSKSNNISQVDLSQVGQFSSGLYQSYKKDSRQVESKQLGDKSLVQSSISSPKNSAMQGPFKPTISQQVHNMNTSKQMNASSIVRQQVPLVKKYQFDAGFEPLKHLRMYSIKGHDKSVRDGVLVDDEEFATCSDEPLVKIWNIKKLQLSYVIEQDNETDIVISLAYNSPMKILACGTSSKDIRIYRRNEVDWQLSQVLKGMLDKVRCLKYFHSNTLLASGGDDATLYIWSLKGELLHNISDPNQNRISCILSTDIHLLVGCNKNILFYNIGAYDNSKPRVLKAHESLVVSLLILEPNVQQKLLDIARQTAIMDKKSGRNNMNQRNRASLLGGPKDERILVSGSRDLRVKLWSYASHELLSTINQDYVPKRICHVEIKDKQQQMNYLVIGTCGFEREGKVVICNISDLKKIFVCSEITENGTGVNTLSLFEDQQQDQIYLVAGYENKRIDLYKLGL